MLKHLVLLSPVVFAVACTDKSATSAVQHLTADPTAANHALVIGADLPTQTGMHLPGVVYDYDAMRQELEDSPLNFDVRGLRNPTADTLQLEVARAARDLDEDATLLIYYSGHGDQDGSLVLPRGPSASTVDTFRLLELAAAVAAGRYTKDPDDPTPVRRLIVILDSCYSGNLVQGEADFTAMDDAVNLAYQQGELPMPRIFQQFVGLSAARLDQTASDGHGGGGAFTTAFTDALDVLAEDDTATIYDLFHLTRDNMEQSGEIQEPQFDAKPYWVASERLN